MYLYDLDKIHKEYRRINKKLKYTMYTNLQRVTEIFARWTSY